MARLGIDRDSCGSSASWSAQSRKVHAALGKFEQATHAGVHLEKIDKVRDARLRSIRIDQSVGSSSLQSRVTSCTAHWGHLRKRHREPRILP